MGARKKKSKTSRESRVVSRPKVVLNCMYCGRVAEKGAHEGWVRCAGGHTHRIEDAVEVANDDG